MSSAEPHGAGVRVEIAGAPDAESSILAEITPAAVAELGIVAGSSMWVAVKASDIDIYPDRGASSAGMEQSEVFAPRTLSPSR